MQNSHWELVVIYPREQRIDILDSLNITLDLRPLCHSLNQIFGVKGSWPSTRPRCGKQPDGTSCGAFVAHHMKLLLTGVAPTGDNVPRKGNKELQKRTTRLIRSKMARELQSQKLDAGIALSNNFYVSK